MTGASDWGLICCGFGCRGSQESVEEPVKRQFWRKATFKVRAEEQSLQMRLERNGEEGRNMKRMGSWKPWEEGVSRSRGWKLESHPTEGVSGKELKGVIESGSLKVIGTLSKSVFSGSGDIIVVG